MAKYDIQAKVMYCVNGRSFDSLEKAQEYLKDQLGELLEGLPGFNCLHPGNKIQIIDQLFESRSAVTAILGFRSYSPTNYYESDDD